MSYRIGDAVRLRGTSQDDERLHAVADLTGTVGDVWTDERGERINVVYEGAGLLLHGWLAAEFVRDLPLDAAPF